jgi:hypothetical protein
MLKYQGRIVVNGGLGLKKLCLSCGCPYDLSGSGKRQKYCQACQKSPKRGVAQVRNLSTSKPLETNDSSTHFSAPIPPAKTRRRKLTPTRRLGAYVLAQIEAKKGQPNPIRFVTPDGTKCRVWLAHDAKGRAGDDVYWGCNVEELLKERQVKPLPWKPTAKALRRPIIVYGRNEPVRNLNDALGILSGIRARVFINAQEELQVLGCGQRIVTIQLRGKEVLLHHNGNTAKMKRSAFKEFLKRNKEARLRIYGKRKVVILPRFTVIEGGKSSKLLEVAA